MPFLIFSSEAARSSCPLLISASNLIKMASIRSSLDSMLSVVSNLMWVENSPSLPLRIHWGRRVGLKVRRGHSLMRFRVGSDGRKQVDKLVRAWRGENDEGGVIRRHLGWQSANHAVPRRKDVWLHGCLYWRELVACVVFEHIETQKGKRRPIGDRDRAEGYLMPQYLGGS